MNISLPWPTFNLQHVRKGRLFPCFWFFSDTNSHSFNLSAGGKASIIDALFHPPNIRWHHEMETFSALLALCVGNSPVTRVFPSQRPVTQSFDVFFDLGLNKRLSKQSLGRWFETPSCSLRHHCNDKGGLLNAVRKIVTLQSAQQGKTGLCRKKS